MLTEPVRYSGPAFAAATGISLCYDTFGDRVDPPIVLIMGLAGQMIVWDDDFCRELSSRGRFVVRFDNRDIGLSTRFTEAKTPSMRDIFLAQVTRSGIRARYTLLDMAKDTIALIDALGLERVHIVGISMGGAIAQEMAIHFRDRLRTLTSIMSSTGDPRLPPPTWQALRVLTQRPVKEREAYLRRYVRTWHVLAQDNFPFDAARMRRQGERSYDRGTNPAGVARQMLAIIASGNRTRALRELAIPTLVIHGTADPLVRFKAGPALAQAIPGAKFLPIEGMGHTLPREAWPAIIGAIEQHTALHG
jgi:pimeloyl-ACP methyl ester carboxylesterase